MGSAFYKALGNGDGIGRPFGGDALVPTQIGIEHNWQRVAIGSVFATCALDLAGGLWCWGSNANYQQGHGGPASQREIFPKRIAENSVWQEIAVGYTHACAIKSDNTLWCWGTGARGQLGTGTTTIATAPQQVSADPVWSQISAGNRHSCAIKSDNTLWCWGQGASGRLGLGSDQSNRNTPNEVVSVNSDWASVAPGGAHTCAIKNNGSLWCWGKNAYGQLGQSNLNDHSSPTRVGTETDWAHVATGGAHTCATKNDGTLHCWGKNEASQLTAAARGDRTQPARVGRALDWKSVTTGYTHSGAPKHDDSLWCWGNNELYEFGNTVTSTTRPVLIDDTRAWTIISTGDQYSCGITSNQMLWCWGRGNQSLGRGPNVDSNGEPIGRVGTEQDWTKVSVGNVISCGTKVDGTLRCWGNNEHGGLGDGTQTNRDVPTPLLTPPSWDTATAVDGLSIGRRHACAHKSNDSLWCWGRNGEFQLGNGSQTSTSIPQRVGTSTETWAKVAAGASHTCATKSDGTLWCWGDNSVGQLGDATTDWRFTATQVGTDQDWAMLSSYTSHTCAIKSDGRIWCWGKNEYGQLGDGTREDRSSVTQIEAHINWQQVSTAPDHSCAIKTDGSLWCWGLNLQGQLGLGISNWRSDMFEIRRPTSSN